MEINKILDGTTLLIELDGRLDTVTAPELGTELEKSIDGITELIFDFADLRYISPAGLRILLQAQKTMNKQGNMIIRNANEEIMNVFDITGFLEFLTVEQS